MMLEIHLYQKFLTTVFGFLTVSVAPALALAASVLTRSGTNPLATTDQAEVEGTALRLLQRTELREAQAEARKLFLADPLAKSPAGAASLEQAVDEYVLSMVYDAILHDVARPRMLWTFTPAHTWFGHRISGARYGIDNPDNVYRIVILDSAGSYEIHARQAGKPPIQFSFQLYADNRFSAVIPGEQAVPADKDRKLDVPLGGLLDTDIQRAKDGSFTITFSPEPANGRPNHIQTPAGNPLLFIRESLSDWSEERPHWMEFRRLDQPSAAAQSDAELAARAVERLRTEVPFWLKFNHASVSDKAPNTLATPRSRGGGWGFSAIGNFNLAKDEALLVTTHPTGARYTGFVVVDPWSISREHIKRSGSLNNAQARPNADGTYTYAIAATDPGIANWLDTDGLLSGGFIVRWQAFPRQPASADGLVREVRLLKIADLEKMSSNVPRLTPAQRAQDLASRARNFERRLTE